MELQPLVIYRAKSIDSFASALAVWMYCPTFQFHAALPEEEPIWEKAKGRIVYLIDYTYSKDWVKRLSRVATCLIVLDHHESSTDLKECLGRQKLRGVIDPTKSGVALTWAWFHGTELPKLFQHISDAHLDKWEMQGTREIMLALEQKPKEFREWEKHLYRTDALIGIGRNLVKKPFAQMYLSMQDIDALAKQSPVALPYIIPEEIVRVNALCA